MTAPDIILPLSNESRFDNDELRVFLRSLEENGRNYGNVWIVTANAPAWLKPGNGLATLYAEDRHRHNKDANLFEKVAVALDVAKSEDVIFTADDCAVLFPVDFGALPPIFNNRGLEKFKEDCGTKWRRRMVATLEELPRIQGINFDTHCPQRWNAERTREAIRVTPYTAPEGRCICTAIMGRIWGMVPPGAVDQRRVKETVSGTLDAEHDIAGAKSARLDRLFVGYDDGGFGGGLRERLFVRFPERSKWEK